VLFFFCGLSETSVITMGDKTMKEFTVIIEKDEDGYFIASVPTLHGCHTQAKSLDTLIIGSCST
jgi:hypothetical protein